MPGVISLLACVVVIYASVLVEIFFFPKATFKVTSSHIKKFPMPFVFISQSLEKHCKKNVCVCIHINVLTEYFGCILVKWLLQLCLSSAFSLSLAQRKNAKALLSVPKVDLLTIKIFPDFHRFENLEYQ